MEVHAFNAEENIYDFADEERGTQNGIVLFLPDGIYDFATCYSSVAPQTQLGSDGRVLIIKENVAVNSDMVIDTDPRDATDYVSFRSFNPDGDMSRLKRVTYDSAESSDYKVIQEGNVNTMFYDTRVVNTEYGFTCYWSVMTDPGYIVEHGYRPTLNVERLMDVRINPVSDRYVIGQNRVIQASEGTYLTEFRKTGSDNITLTNDASQYYDISPSFHNKPVDNNDTMPYILMYQTMWDSKMEGDHVILRSVNDAVHKVKYCPNHGQYNPDMPACNITFAVVDKQLTQPNGVWAEYWQEEPPLCLIDSDTNQYVITTSDSNMYPGDQSYSFPYDIAFKGECAPWMEISYSGFYLFKQDKYKYETFISHRGLMFDTRNDDYSLSCNGSIVDSDIDKWIESLDNDDLIELVVNSESVTIDGLQGCNKTEIRTNPKTGDRCAPSLKMLQMKNGEGFLTNRFKNSDDVNIDFSYGDFNLGFDDDFNSFISEDDADVLLEYASYGTSTWQPLKAVEMEDLYFPGLGKHMKADTSSIESKPDDTWYDLRFTLTDKAGNEMTQTISPAFMIEKTVGIMSAYSMTQPRIQVSGEIITIEDIDVSAVRIYTMEGKQVAYTNTSVIGISNMPNDLYLIKITDVNGHIYVSKLSK